MVAGYSGTPLPKKLGIREGSRVGYRGAPKGLAATLGQLPLSARLAPSRPGGVDDILLLFAPDQRSLDEALPDMLSRMAPETSLWICWQRKPRPSHPISQATPFEGRVSRQVSWTSRSAPSTRTGPGSNSSYVSKTVRRPGKSELPASFANYNRNQNHNRPNSSRIAQAGSPSPRSVTSRPV